MKNNRKQQRSDVRFVRQAGKIMCQWEQQRSREIEERTFLLTPQSQARAEHMMQCVRSARIQPAAFCYAFDPVYNQFNFTLEDRVLSNQCYALHEMLSAADAYSLEALADGRIILSLSIHDAAYEMEG